MRDAVLLKLAVRGVERDARRVRLRAVDAMLGTIWG